MVSVGIIGIIFTIISNNSFAYLLDFISTVYIILYLLTFFIELLSHYLKHRSN